MLAIGFFLAAASLPFSYAATATSQLLLDASDPSLVFSAGWTTQFSNASGSDYLQTDTVLGSLTASLPANTSSVSFVAYPRAGGSSYGYTVDCQNDCILTTVNAIDPSAGNPSFVQASTLFSLNLDPSFEHILRVYNIPSNLPGGLSEITFDHLVVGVQDNAQGHIGSSTGTAGNPSSTASLSSSVPVTLATTTVGIAQTSSAPSSTSPITSIPTSSPAVSDSVLDPSTTANGSDASQASSSASSASTNSSSGPSVKLIAGVTVLSLFFVGAVIATVIVVLKQRRARQREMQVPPSRASSIIPIMPPPPAPEMRSGVDSIIGSPRQFSSPRRMDGRLLTPTTAPPTYPLPLPPTVAHPIGDYWTSRPVRNQFSPV